ncbi:MAG: A24 family peptidase [Clostridiales bacterium]|jgi:prepilin signal peptidase PulO-like enzyme (type II secretory pathway)|nr:A24 family peptidase [Clostridiales bacterium]
MKYIIAVVVGLAATAILGADKVKEMPVRARVLTICASGLSVTLMCLAAARKSEMSPRFAVLAVPGIILTYLSVYDILLLAVSNETIVSAALCALLLLPLNGDVAWWAALASAGALFSLFALISRLTKGALGLGDAMIIGVVGLFTGANAVYIITYAVVFSGIASLVLLISKRAHKGASIPFAPFLCAGFFMYIIL